MSTLSREETPEKLGTGHFQPEITTPTYVVLLRNFDFISQLYFHFLCIENIILLIYSYLFI